VIPIKLIDVNFNSGKGWQPGVSLSIPPKLVRWDRFQAEKFEGPVVLTDYRLWSPCVSRCKIAWLVESPDIAPELYARMRRDYSSFRRVITFHRDLLGKVPNAVEGLMGGSHVRTQDVAIHPKTKLVSMIASSKHTTAGRKFRCQIATSLASGVDLFGRGRPRTLEHKAEGLNPYAFSVAVENCRTPDYFSEKLIDCFLTGTVPIYWGLPGIDRWFNRDGIMAFDTEADARRIVGSLTMDQYRAMLPAVTDNFYRAQKFACPEDELFRRGLFQP
jgi:hypothetical protein